MSTTAEQKSELTPDTQARFPEPELREIADYHTRCAKSWSLSKGTSSGVAKMHIRFSFAALQAIEGVDGPP